MAAMEKNNKTINGPHLRFPEFSGEWKKCTIGDFGNVITGNTPPTAEDKNYDNGTHLWASPADLGTTKYIESTQTLLSDRGFEKSRSFPANSILVTCIGSTIGKMGMSKTEMASNQQINTIVPVQHDANFVYYAVQSRFPRYLSSIAVQAVPILSKSSFEKLTNYTTARKEQIKIGNLLSLIDERIDTQKKIIEDLKKLKDAINNSLHNNINEFHLFSFNELGNDYSGLTGKSSDDFGLGLPYISYLNVFRNDIVTDGPFDCVKVSKTEKQNIVNYGDLLFTLSSETPSEVGIGAIYLGKTNTLYLNSFCFGVHLSNQENIYGPYLAYFVTSQYFRRTILPFAQGSTRYNLMKSDFMKHKFCFPNMASQKAIYNALHTLSEKIQNEEVCLNKYAEQKQYLLTRLFI